MSQERDLPGNDDGGPADAGGVRRLTHVDETGAARMVDVSAKAVTTRTATAGGRLLVSPAVVELLRGEGVPKGDALGVARIAGIMGAKRTAELVPLCHPIALSGVKVDLTVRDEGVDILATVRTTDRTGVEMEALTAVAVAGLALHDMVKAVDPAAELTGVRLLEKTGGRSGVWRRSGYGGYGGPGGPGTADIATAGTAAAGVAPAGVATAGAAAVAEAAEVTEAAALPGGPDAGAGAAVADGGGRASAGEAG